MLIFIETLGCPKNANDTELLIGLLEDENHKIIDRPEDSEILIINTCGFINDAKIESIDKIFEMVNLKNEDRKKIIIVTGCLSKRYHKELLNQIPEVDIFLGVNEYSAINTIIEDFIKNKEKNINYRYSKVEEAEEKYKEIECREKINGRISASLRISEGCNNTCAYCVIPEIRGRFRSRKIENIVNEARNLVNQGVKEIILIAQDVTAYGIDIYGKYNLDVLLKELVKIKELKWIRLMYCYEDRITDDLIEIMRNEEKICNYIDIPLQHGNDTILKLMNRRSTQQGIKEKIKKLKDAIPDIHIRTTIITGFPGEKVKEFNDLVQFIEEMKFERLGVFSYSKEENTPASKMKPQVRKDVKEKRKNLIMNKQMDISLNNNKKKIGKILEVLIEGIVDEGSYIGRTEYDAPEIDNSVIVKSEKKLKIGEFVLVKICEAYDYDLEGELIENEFTK